MTPAGTSLESGVCSTWLGLEGSHTSGLKEKVASDFRNLDLRDL